MTIRVILVPYHLGHRGAGLGAGPLRILDAGLTRMLDEALHTFAVTMVELPEPPQHELGATFELNRRLARAVGDAVAAGEFPLVLAGNCNSCLGTMAGMQSAAGIVWFDAHGDFNSPETSTTGFFDGMALNVAVGRSWKAAASTITGFGPVPEAACALLGVRDLDVAEKDLLARSDVAVAGYESLKRGRLDSGVTRCLDSIATHTNNAYLHVDLDVMDRDLVPANQFSPPGGMTPQELSRALKLVGERLDVRAAALTAYNPEVDTQGLALSAALSVIDQIAEIGAAD
jgi:arginase